MLFTPAMVAMVLTAVLVGAVLQRLSGTGMGLVLSPVLTVLLGAATGVLVANSTTVISALMMLVALRRDVDWPRVELICVSALPGTLLGALVVHSLPAPWLQVLVGAVVLAAILFTTVAGALGRLPHLTGRWVTPTFAAVGASFNTMAGVSAPVMVVHSRLVRWEQKHFAASMQPVFACMGFLSVLVKSLLVHTGAGLPPWWLLPMVVATVVVGIVLGTRISRRVTGDQARHVAQVLAGLGGLAALVRGLLAL